MMQEREQLEELLNCDIDFKAFNLYIWGTGNTSDLYQEGLKRLEEEGIIIRGYFDNNSEKWGKEYNGNVVLEPKLIRDMDNPFVLIASPKWPVIRQIGLQLNQVGVPSLPIDSFVVKTHTKEILQVYDMLDDRKSKYIYATLIKARITGEAIPEECIDDNQYFFYKYLTADPGEVFVDCGAFVGDSFEQYLWKRCGVFKKALIFEPDEINVQAINRRITRLKEEWNITDDKIVIYPYGLSDIDSVNYLKKNDALNGLSSKLVVGTSDETEECKIVALDSVLENENYYIKADIESYEYKMLLGTKKTIINHSPRIAVCIYHNSVDFYSIPLLLRELNENYKFSIRHYTNNLSETVLYAYTEEG